MTEVTRLPNGNLLLPLQIDLPGGGGMGTTKVDPGDPCSRRESSSPRLHAAGSWPVPRLTISWPGGWPVGAD